MKIHFLFGGLGFCNTFMSRMNDLNFWNELERIEELGKPVINDNNDVLISSKPAGKPGNSDEFESDILIMKVLILKVSNLAPESTDLEESPNWNSIYSTMNGNLEAMYEKIRNRIFNELSAQLGYLY